MQNEVTTAYKGVNACYLDKRKLLSSRQVCDCPRGTGFLGVPPDQALARRRLSQLRRYRCRLISPVVHCRLIPPLFLSFQQIFHFSIGFFKTVNNDEMNNNSSHTTNILSLSFDKYKTIHKHCINNKQFTQTSVSA